MRINIDSEYSLVMVRYMCQAASGTPISSKQISEAEAYPLEFIRKILKGLARRGIVKSVRGRQGGYLLARPPSQITLKEIIKALDGEVFWVFCEPHHVHQIICTHFCECSLRPIWNELNEVIGDFLAGITLQTLLDREEKVREELRHRKVVAATSACLDTAQPAPRAAFLA